MTFSDSFCSPERLEPEGELALRVGAWPELVRGALAVVGGAPTGHVHLAATVREAAAGRQAG